MTSDNGAFVDLHVHSTASDGSVSPDGVVRRAAKAGLSAVALTDHDTVDGIPEAMQAGEREGVRVIGGCEVSVGARWGGMDVLGDFLPVELPALGRFFEGLRADRIRRAQGMGGRI